MAEHTSEKHCFNSKCCCCGSPEQGQFGDMRLSSNFTNFSVFETLSLWAAGVQLEGGRL